jgi:pimeloyl-ACP methyl ester carboxylesterase
LPGENVIVGHSMGGFQALYTTTIAPLLFKFALAIEPVTHNTAARSEAFMTNMLSSLNIAIRSEFKNEEEYYTFFKEKSFYKNFHPQILNDFVEAEKVVNRDGTVSAKTSKEQQLLCYLAGGKIFPLGLGVLKSVPVPVIFVAAGSGTWLELSAVEEAKKAIKDIEFISVPGAQHLMNGEQPDDILKILVDGLKKHIGTSSTAIKEKVYISKEEYDGIFKENYAKLERDYFTRKANKL